MSKYIQRITIVGILLVFCGDGVCGGYGYILYVQYIREEEDGVSILE